MQKRQDNISRSNRPSTGSLYVPSVSSTSPLNVMKDKSDNSSKQSSKQSRTVMVKQSRQGTQIQEKTLIKSSTKHAKSDCESTIQWIQNVLCRKATTFVIPSPLILINQDYKCQELDVFDSVNAQGLVVGVLGKQSVGKSTLLSQLTSTNVFKSFKTQEKECTVGIQGYQSPERILYLDTQPLSSPILISHLKSLRKIPGKHLSNPNSWNEVVSRSISEFILSICDITLIVLDQEKDLALLSFILNILKQKSTASTTKLIIIFNKISSNKESIDFIHSPLNSTPNKEIFLLQEPVFLPFLESFHPKALTLDTLPEDLHDSIKSLEYHKNIQAILNTLRNHPIQDKSSLNSSIQTFWKQIDKI